MIHKATSRQDLAAVAAEPLVVVFLSVEWPGPERLSRRVFTEFEALLAEERPGTLLPCWIANEETEEVVDWLRDLGLSEMLSGGWGAVAWLSRGRPIASELNAASVGTSALLTRTLALLGRAS